MLSRLSITARTKLFARSETLLASSAANDPKPLVIQPIDKAAKTPAPDFTL